MVKVGVISDIHANWEALQAMLGYFEEQGIERILCLGDIVGYGPDPIKCLNELAEREEQGLVYTIGGNHDRNIMEVWTEDDVDIGLAVESLNGNKQAKRSWRYTHDQLSCGFSRKEWNSYSPQQLKELAEKRVRNEYVKEAEELARKARLPLETIEKIIKNDIETVATRLQEEQRIMKESGWGSRRRTLKSSAKVIGAQAELLKSRSELLKTKLPVEKKPYDRVIFWGAETTPGKAYAQLAQAIDESACAINYLSKIINRYEIKEEFNGVKIHGVHSNHLDPKEEHAEKYGDYVMTKNLARMLGVENFTSPQTACKAYEGDANVLVCGDTHYVTKEMNIRKINERYHICVGSIGFPRNVDLRRSRKAVGYIIDTQQKGNDMFQLCQVGTYDWRLTRKKCKKAQLSDPFEITLQEEKVK